jgi:multidrug efflux pump
MFTDIFIKRPVLASVLSLLILVFGLRSLHELPLRQFPEVENTVITVTTTYPGASAELIQGFITGTIEKSIASADGIDYLTANSSQGQSVIQAHIKLNFDPNVAFTSVSSKVAAITNLLPKQSNAPLITKDTGSSIDLMYISFTDKNMSPEEITDYVSRVIQPKLETIADVAKAEILGGNTYAMRIWLNPKKMAAFNLTAADITQALQTKNIQSAAGTTKGAYVVFNIQTDSALHTAKDFQNIVIGSFNGALVHLKNVARIELGSQSYDSSVTFNGKQAIFVGINTKPTANPLDVIAQVKKILPTLEASYPAGFKSTVVYDATNYIRASIHEVIRTIIEATAIVLIIIFMFLGAFRSVIIPVITIPLSLIGVASVMLAMGYSLNLLTLLAMVLAIGMVVDDAIVVVENIHRHLEDGLSSIQASLKGAREIAIPIVTMTMTLAAVYAPIGLLGGLTGALFKEFAFTLAGAVIISGIIALTLSPMMCSRMLKKEDSQLKLVQIIEKTMLNLKIRYHRILHHVLDFRPLVLVVGGMVLLSCFFFYSTTKKELAPTEDQSILFVSATAPQYANLDYVSYYTRQINNIFKSLPETQDYFVINGMGAVNNAIGGIILKPWNERKKSQQDVLNGLQPKLAGIGGLSVVAFPLPSLPTGDNGLPLQFVLTSTGDYKTLYDAAMKVKGAAMKSGLFMFLDNDLKYNNPQQDLHIDAKKAAALGITPQDISNALAIGFGGNYVNLFSREGQSYQVIPQLDQQYRANPHQISHIYLKTASGQVIPLSTIATQGQPSVVPNQLPEFQQLNSITIQGLMMPMYSMGQGLDYLKQQVEALPNKSITYDYAGQSRQFIQEGSALLGTMFFALIIIFLVLAAQFESFVDPLIILISVPMSICGALIPLNLGLASINIYTQIGLITLIGLISKHGILMVDFANHLQVDEKLSKREAIEKAAAIRLRPILMTTAAMVFGVLPLLIATGAGAISRFDIGLVIASGMAIGTFFTLFMVPTMYTLIAKDRNKTIKK